MTVGHASSLTQIKIVNTSGVAYRIVFMDGSTVQAEGIRMRFEDAPTQNGAHGMHQIAILEELRCLHIDSV